jgi:hypothetical protein
LHPFISPQIVSYCEHRRRRHSSSNARHLDVHIGAYTAPASDHRRHHNQEDRQPLWWRFSLFSLLKRIWSVMLDTFNLVKTNKTDLSFWAIHIETSE